MNSYFWKYQFGLYGNYNAIYLSGVDTGQEGEWKLVEMWPIWEITRNQTAIFKTEQSLKDFVDASYKEYQANNKRDYFEYLFSGMGLFKSIWTFIKYYINMEKP